MIKIKLDKLIPFVYFPLLVVIILGPLLNRGYIFLLDFISTPNKFDFSTQAIINSLPYYSIVVLLNSVFPTDIIQKLILVSALLLIMCGIWYSLPKKIELLPRLITTTFYILNPFVYERFMAGHVGVLFGYGLLPLILRSFYKIFEDRTLKNIFKTAVLMTIQFALLGLHFIIIDAVILITIFLFNIINNYLNKKPTPKELYENIKSDSRLITKIFFAGLILNIWWLIPIFIQSNNPTDNFSNEHFSAYTSSADPKYGKFINLLGMYGFWRERTSGNEILLTKDFLPAWPLFLLIFFIPITLGIIHLWKEKKYSYLGSLMTMAIFSIAFSFGPSENWLGQINSFIFTYIPGFKGLRESQKFISLSVLVYTILLAYGLNYIKLKTKWLYAAVSLLVFINIFFFNYKFLWGATGQVRVVDYPVSFIETKKILDEDKGEYKILVLPWHSYLVGHPLAQGRTIADPALPYLYPHDLIISTNEDTGYEKTDNRGDDTRVNFLLKSTDPTEWYQVLAKMKVKYIFVTKLKDVNKNGFEYDFIVNSPNFIKIIEDDTAVLFKAK